MPVSNLVLLHTKAELKLNPARLMLLADHGGVGEKTGNQK